MAEYADRGGAIKARRNDYIKLIDAVKARHGCNRKCSECDFAEDGDSWCSGEVFVVDLLRVPAADVRPVVLCKDCKWCHAGYCEKYDDLIPFGCANKPWKDWFCADGERMDMVTDSNQVKDGDGDV